MNIESDIVGTVLVREHQIFEFPEGIPGFPAYKRYALLKEADYHPFWVLQSMDESKVGFVLLEPKTFLSGYVPECAPADLDKICVVRMDQCRVYVIVNIPENTAEMTANLQGPVLINEDIHRGIQAISTNPEHPIRFRIVSGDIR